MFPTKLPSGIVLCIEPCRCRVCCGRRSSLRRNRASAAKESRWPVSIPQDRLVWRGPSASVRRHPISAAAYRCSGERIGAELDSCCGYVIENRQSTGVISCCWWATSKKRSFVSLSVFRRQKATPDPFLLLNSVSHVVQCHGAA